MFKMIEGLTKAVVGVAVELPVAAVTDLVSLGSAHPKVGNTYTGEALRGVMDNLQKATHKGG